MNTTHAFQFSSRRWSLVLFLAVLIGIAQFGLGQFAPWVIAAPFVALLVMDIEAAWSRGHGAGSQAAKSQTLASSATKGVMAQAAAAFVFHGLVIGAVMTAAGGAGRETSGRFVMAKSAGGGGCGSGGMCGGGQAAVGTLASSATTKSGCGSGGCGAGAGGCGSGGCGGGGSAVGTVASSATGAATRAKSACGCGSGGTVAGSASKNQTLASSATGRAAAMPNANQMRLGLPPIMARPNGTVPGVSNQPVSISPQAMAAIGSLPKVTVPRPPPTLLAKPATPVSAPVEKGTADNRSLPGSTAAPAGKEPATSQASQTPAAAKAEEGSPKESTETKNEPKVGGSE